MMRLSRSALVPALLMVVAAIWFRAPAKADVPASVPTVSVIAMGDWGDGGKGQKAVAEELATFAASQPSPVDAMLLAGDNFYVPLKDVDDPAWTNLFENMYDARRLPMPFYASLGNHDYPVDKVAIEMGYARQHPDSRWKLPAHWYRVDMPKDHPLVSVLVLDSNKDFLSADQWAGQLKWIDAELSKPHEGVWTIAMAHHPVYSNGSHGDIGPLQIAWAPLFKKYNLDFYICGHDHDLQHLQIDGVHTSFLLVGGGGRKTSPMRRDNRGPFSRSIMGFADLVFTPEKATVRYIDRDGNVLHSFEKTRDGAVTVLSTTGMDKATTKPLKAIQGIEGN